MKNQKEKDENPYLIPIILLVLAGFFVFLFLTPDKKAPSSRPPAQSKEFEAKVNRHLFKTSQEIEMNRQKMQVEANDIANKGLRPLPPASDQSNGVDLSVDPRAQSLVEDLGRQVRESGNPKNSHDVIQAELFQQEQLNEYTEEYKREYARQFVENAKKAGYRVILNDQYKVISVTPIRKPAQDFKLFDPGSGGAQ